MNNDDDKDDECKLLTNVASAALPTALTTLSRDSSSSVDSVAVVAVRQQQHFQDTV